jgi:hypothetical protein
MADKFSADFSTALELLGMFNDAITNAFVEQTGPYDEVLQQIYPNVNELHQRLKELKPTIPDPYVTRVITYLEEYCELCKTEYSSFARSGELDVDALAEMASRGLPEQAPPPRTDLVDDLLDFGPPPAKPQQKPPAQPPRSQQPPPQQKPKSKADPFAGFEFADDLPEDGVSNDEFAAFLDNISTKRK